MLGMMEDVLSEISEEIMDERGGLPPGFRFHPTDEELITFYLASKVFNGSFCGIPIAEIDLNRCEPWELPDVAKMGEKEWYFFSLRDRKYPTGLRTNRATGAGYWKATGKDREVHSASTGALLGMKKTLVFYRGRAPRGEKTKWVMHEYRLEGDFSCRRTGKEEWVICRIFHKTMEKKNAHYPEGRSYNINEIYNLSEDTKLIANPSSPALFLPNRDLLIPARDRAAPAPKQCCKAEAADNCSSSVVFPQLLLPDLAPTDFHTEEFLQSPNLLIFGMGCCHDGMNPSAGDLQLQGMAAFNSSSLSSSSSSAISRALIGSSWPLLDP